MSTAPRYLAKYAAPPPPAFLKAPANSVALTFKSLLTYPMHDLAGDYVVPSGCDFTPHAEDPCIDLEHRRHPMVKGMPVAWARESLGEPGAPYAVEMVKLNFAGEGNPADWHTVPVGTEFFNKSCRVSMQVFALRESGGLPASSLEFSMVPGFYKAIGWSEMERRDAYYFDRVAVQRWTVCERGVNPGAMTLTKSRTAPPQVPCVLGKILADKRLNVGGTYEPLHGYILKALAPEGPPAKRTTVRVEHKAMDPLTAPQDDELTTTNEDAVEEMAPPAKPTVQSHYDLAQGMLDLIDQAEAQLEGGEHVGGKKFLMKKFEKLRADVEDIKANGDKIDAELSKKGGDAEPEDGDEEDDPLPEPVEKDGDGVMKGIRPVYRKAIKRFRLADLVAAPPARTVAKSANEPELTPEQEAALTRRLARAERRLGYVS
jgi:hypothetical protein